MKASDIKIGETYHQSVGHGHECNVVAFGTDGEQVAVRWPGGARGWIEAACIDPLPAAPAVAEPVVVALQRFASKSNNTIVFVARDRSQDGFAADSGTWIPTNDWLTTLSRTVLHIPRECAGQDCAVIPLSDLPAFREWKANQRDKYGDPSLGIWTSREAIRQGMDTRPSPTGNDCGMSGAEMEPAEDVDTEAKYTCPRCGKFHNVCAACAVEMAKDAGKPLEWVTGRCPAPAPSPAPVGLTEGEIDAAVRSIAKSAEAKAVRMWGEKPTVGAITSGFALAIREHLANLPSPDPDAARLMRLAENHIAVAKAVCLEGTPKWYAWRTNRMDWQAFIMEDTLRAAIDAAEKHQAGGA